MIMGLRGNHDVIWIISSGEDVGVEEDERTLKLTVEGDHGLRGRKMPSLTHPGSVGVNL